MGMVKPSPEQYKPEDDLKLAGQYVTQCTGVRQGLDYPAHPDKTRVAIEFTVDDSRHPKQKGKKVAIVVPESIYVDKKTGRESFFLQYCRAMGAIEPERGCDPDQFIGRWFLVTAIVVGERCAVRAAVPIPTPNPNLGIITSAGLPAPGTLIEQDEKVPF